MRASLRERYGAGPLHLLSAAASFAVVGVAVAGWFDEPFVSLKYILIWFGGAIVAHDMVLWPLYSGLDRLLAGTARAAGGSHGAPTRTPARVYVRVPALLSGLLLLVFGPEILEEGDATFHVASGLHQHVYLGRYLALVAILFGFSALAYLLATARARRRHA